MPVVKRSSGTRSRARFALVSLLAHALLLLFAATRQDRPAPSTAATAAPTAIELDVVPLPADAHEPASTGEMAAPAAGAAPARASSGSKPAAAPTPDALVSSAEGRSEGPEEAAEPAGSAGPPLRRLGLGELGVGSRNPFLDPRVATPAPAEDRRAKVKKRLDDALAQGLQDRDTALGLGAGSPVMRALETAVYASTAPLNGDALFTFLIDSEGKLLSTQLGAVSSDREKWERVARRAAQSLATRKLRVPKGKNVRLTIAVASHLELPSGRDPGVSLRAFGIPLKKGGGERATSIDILNPLNPGAPLLLDGDPADIGATARRMVRAHVVSEELL